MELLLVRHGLPLRVENTDGQPADPPLSPRGLEQAEQIADWLATERIGAIHASPLRRAHETALPLAKRLSLEVKIEPGVVEFDRDAEVYVPLEQLKQEDPRRWRDLVQGGLHAGIDLPAFQRTVIATLERIIAEYPGGHVAVFCHGGVVNTWAGHVLGIENPLFFDPGYTSVSRFLAAGSGERSVVSLNETGHLRGESR